MTLPPAEYESLKSGIVELRSQLLCWRRHLHRHPELANEEFETTKYLRKVVRGFGLRVIPLRMKTGLIAEIQGKRSGLTVAIRSDIDALPIRERTGLKYQSKSEGRMHACGHDVHMATVLGTAALLSRRRSRLAGTVRLIFQPAEEKPPGGARPMIENGALKDVSLILGLHVDPHLRTGRISVRDGLTMGSVYDFDLVIRGRGGHAARSHLAVDAIVTAAEVVESLQKVTSRETDPVSPVVISFGRIEGGAARNVVADEVTVAGTARALSDQISRRIPAMIKRTVAGVCRARGASFEIKQIASYPALKNDPAVNRLIESNYARLFGKGKVATTEPVLGGEDFSCYLGKVPGAFFRLGVMNKKIGADKPWHSPEFRADEDAMEYGAALLAACAVDFLEYADS